MSLSDSIIFVDGYCVACSRFAQFVDSFDKTKYWHLSTLQGKTADQLISEDIKAVDSIVVFDGEFYIKSEAVLTVFQKLPYPWRAVGVLKIVPRFFRDLVYDLIAKYRMRIFGSKNQCDLKGLKDQSRTLP